jgi:hypothetical protein
MQKIVAHDFRYDPRNNILQRHKHGAYLFSNVIFVLDI